MFIVYSVLNKLMNMHRLKLCWILLGIKDQQAQLWSKSYFAWLKLASSIQNLFFWSEINMILCSLILPCLKWMDIPHHLSIYQQGCNLIYLQLQIWHVECWCCDVGNDLRDARCFPDKFFNTYPFGPTSWGLEWGHKGAGVQVSVLFRRL